MGLQHVHQQHPVSIATHFPDSPVEGEAPGERVQRIERRVLSVGSVVGFAAAAGIGYAIGGGRGVILGVTVFSAYFLLGWWPYFAAAHYRRRSHED